MPVKLRNAMPLSLVVQDPAWLKKEARDDITFALDVDGQDKPVMVVLVEGDDQQIELTITPSQLDALMEEMSHLQAVMQWQMAQPYWLFVRYSASPRSKWHLRLKQWGSGHLCPSMPRSYPYKEEVIPAGTTLWNGTCCAECVRLWMQQIADGWIRYQYVQDPHANSKTTASPTTS